MSPLVLVLIGIFVILFCILVLRLHAVLSLLFAAVAVGLLTGEQNLIQFAQSKGLSAAETAALIDQPVGERIAVAFGNTASKIGILIAMASIIGIGLLRSGAADRIVRGALQLFGEKRAPAAFLSSGFTLGIPVFFDTVFYLMVPLSKAMTLRTKKDYLFYLTAVVAGASMAHSLVPPTPGPLFVAAEMGIDIGVMMFGGLVVGLFTIIAGYSYAAWANKKWTIPLRDSGDVSISELEELSKKENHHLPALWLSLMPIILPFILISGNTITQATMGQKDNLLTSSFSFLGDSNMALTAGAVVALGTLAWYIPDRKKLNRYVLDALHGAGVIVLITSMGGAFGGILQQTGIGVLVQELAGAYQMAILPLAFFVTSLLRTAQGSATVAMITSVGIVGGMANISELAFHPIYLALAIGCGSKPFSWMNDSGFWVVCTMSGMTEGETIKTFSFVLSVMAVVGLLVIMILANLFPFV
jgi:GntP family gluconate:H+ symporter